LVRNPQLKDALLFYFRLDPISGATELLRPGILGWYWSSSEFGANQVWWLHLDGHVKLHPKKQYLPGKSYTGFLINPRTFAGPSLSLLATAPNPKDR
jgi:hypothetical protein